VVNCYYASQRFTNFVLTPECEITANADCIADLVHQLDANGDLLPTIRREWNLAAAAPHALVQAMLIYLLLMTDVTSWWWAEARQTRPQRGLLLLLLSLAQQVLLTGSDDSEKLLLLPSGYAVGAACLMVDRAVHSGDVEDFKKDVSDLHDVERRASGKLDCFMVNKECSELTELTFGDVREAWRRRWCWRRDSGRLRCAENSAVRGLLRVCRGRLW
jgi:hypothetical protein